MRILIPPGQDNDSTMKRTRHTARYIISKLKEALLLIVKGKTVAKVAALDLVEAAELRPLKRAVQSNAVRRGQADDTTKEGGSQITCREKLLSPDRRRRAVMVQQGPNRSPERLGLCGGSTSPLPTRYSQSRLDRGGCAQQVSSSGRTWAHPSDRRMA